MKTQDNDGTIGLTLIELVVAMALFALVAVMAVQSLSGIVRTSDRLAEIDDANATLGVTLALLRNDVSSVVPMRFYPPQSAPLSAVWQNEAGTMIGLSLGGQPTVEDAATDRHFAEWRFRPEDGTLRRRHWPTLLPPDVGQVTDEYIVMRGVTGFTLQTYWPGTGWVDGHLPPLTTQIRQQATNALDQDRAVVAPAAYFSNLPAAVRIVIGTAQWGDLPLVQALQ
ncbi:type II secretion system protein GspJ [Tateyamaria sp. syn59]|uniref:type II secretion system protein GspJ n=1 Tax=Tateyamaria sp. syn59 TaxID=2576942 RepID=UPI0011BEEDA5|nr:type II secretion system protein GspJ [Tateyamaria sp. syn59]